MATPQYKTITKQYKMSSFDFRTGEVTEYWETGYEVVAVEAGK